MQRDLEALAASCNAQLDDSHSDPIKLSILSEKFGKVARGFARQDEPGLAQLYFRFSQVAANKARLEYFLQNGSN